MPSADFCLITLEIAYQGAIGFHLFRSLCSMADKEPRHLSSGSLTAISRWLVKQISPDKNVNCRCTASSFTVSLEPVDFVTLCPLIPETQPYMTFLFVGSQFCTQASFSQHLAMLQLPSASSYNHSKLMNEVGSPTEDFHLISSRPCWAYQKNQADGQKRHGFCYRKKLRPFCPPLILALGASE